MNKKSLFLVFMVFTLSVFAEPYFGEAFVYRTDPRDPNDEQVADRLDQAALNCQASPQSCPVDGEFWIQDEETGMLGVYTWTGGGWNGHLPGVARRPLGVVRLTVMTMTLIDPVDPTSEGRSAPPRLVERITSGYWVAVISSVGRIFQLCF